MYEETRENLLQISGQNTDGPPPLPPRVKFTFGCHGRDCEGNETLEIPVTATLSFCQNPMRSVFSAEIECKWATGGYRQRCMASHQACEDHDPHGHKVECPYVTSIGFLEGKHKGPYPIHRNY